VRRTFRKLNTPLAIHWALEVPAPRGRRNFYKVEKWSRDGPRVTSYNRCIELTCVTIESGRT
jgi:hypothetical protein